MVLGPVRNRAEADLVPGFVLVCKEGESCLIVSPLPGSQQSLLVTSPRVTEAREEKLQVQSGEVDRLLRTARPS